MIRVEGTSKISVGQWVQLVASDSGGRTVQYMYGNMPIKVSKPIGKEMRLHVCGL